MATSRRRIEIAAIADLVVIEAVGSDWMPADLICSKAGIPRTQGRRTAARLAKAGVLERREVEWRSVRSRIRRRFEYRLPQDCRDAWLRFPAWLEPAWHPVDCSKARRIVGKTIQPFSESPPMTESDLYELPLAVRSRFQAIPDSDFDDHPEVTEMRARLEALEEQHREAVAAHVKLTTQLRGLQTQAEWARGEASRLNDGRARRLTEILLSGDHDLTQDRSVLEQIGELHHFSDAVAVAVPQIEKAIPQAANSTRQTVSSMEGLQDALRGLLDKLKLAEAERQAYA